jgi:hypothetical protein
MRIMMSLVVASALACGPDVGDDEESGADDGADEESGADDGDDGSSSTNADVDESTSDAMASSDDASTGSACDADCESLDEAACRACTDCTVLDGTPWETDSRGQWCLGDSVYLGCQTGVCFGQTNTWCSDTAYELDEYCIPQSGGLDPCEPPVDDFPRC